LILVTVVAYVLIYKIPLPCYGCESESIWYRCISGTGKGTSSCDAHKKVTKLVSQGSGVVSTISEQGGVFLENLWEFTTDDLPGVIKDFILQIKDTLKNLKPAIAAKITAIIKFLKEKARLIADKIKDVATSTYNNYIKVVIDPLVSFVTNNIIQPMVFVIEKIISFRVLVWDTLKDAVEAVSNLGIGSFVGSVVDIIKGIPDVLEDLRDLIIQLINNIKTKIFSAVNWGLESSTNLVNKSVNGMSNTLEAGLDKSVDLINTVVGGVETGVGGIVTGVNKSMNLVENVTNTLGNGVESSINKIVSAVNVIDDAFERIADKKIVGARPFSFLSGLTERVSSISIKDLEIDDVSKPTFGEVSSPDIPTINIQAPTVNEPDDIDADKLNLSIPGFGFVGAKVADLKNSIREIFERTMNPLYTAVKTIIALIASVVSSIATFFKTYVNFSGLKTGVGIILGVVKDQLINLKDFVVEQVIPSFIEILKTIKDPIVDFVGILAGKAWAFLKIVGENVGKLFKKAYSMATKLLGSVTKNVFHMVTYTLGTVSDKTLFFVPGPTTVKMFIVVAIVTYVLLGSFVKNFVDILKILFIPVKTVALTISETDKTLDTLFGF